MNDVTGSGQTSPFTTGAPASPPPNTAPMTSTIKAAAPTDVLGGHTVVQQLPEQRWGRKDHQVYLADMRHPILEGAMSPEEAGAPTPFEPSWQKAVNKFHKDLVKKHLNVKKPDGSTMTDTEVQEKATKKTQTDWKLPNSWHYGTQNSQDWTPIETNVTPPVNLNGAKTELLSKNLQKTVASLENNGKKLLAKGGLPPNDPSRLAVGDLVKVLSKAMFDLQGILQQMEITDADKSGEMSQARFKESQESYETAKETQAKNAEIADARKQQEKVGGIIQAVSIGVAVAFAVFAVASAVFTGGGSLVIAAAVVAGVMAGYTVLDSKYQLTAKAMDGFNSMLDKICENGPPWLKTFLQVVAVAFVAIILCAAIAASGGAAAGTVTQQVFAEVAKQMTIQLAVMFIMSSNVLPQLAVDALTASGAIDKNDETAKMVVQMIVMAMTMIVTMRAISSQQEGQGIAKSIGNTVIEGAASVKRGLTQFGSGIAKLAVITAQGDFDALKNELRQIINNLMRMLTQMGTQFKGGIEDAINNAMNAAKEFKTALRESAAKISLESAKELLMAAGERVTESLKTLQNLLAEASKKASLELKEIALSTLDGLRNVVAGLKELDPRTLGLKNLLEGMKDIFDPRPFVAAVIKGITGAKQSMAEWQKIVQQAQDLTTILGATVESAGSIYIGVIGLYVQSVLRDLGDLEKEQEVTQLLIKLFQRLLDGFQSEMTDLGEWSKNIQQMTSADIRSAASQAAQA